MPCKVCGKPLNTHTRYHIAWGHTVEALCWGCRVWTSTGYVIPERRA